MGDLTDLSLAEVASHLRDGRVRSRDLAERALANARLGAYVEVDPARTLQQADAADAALSQGHDPGPLAGIPVSFKDLYGVPGYSVHAGTPRRLPERFERPGPLAAAVLAQLAVVTGKTHTVELAFGGLGTNPHHPTPLNPWDAQHHRAPGGSSAGAGVSVAEGSAMVAFGTDTAGSVRIPAAWTGNVGLKTTAGRWSLEGIVPLSSTLDTPGVLTRTVRDAAEAFFAVDPQGRVPLPSVDPTALRVGRCDDLLFDDCSPGVVEAVEEALRELERAGATIVPLELPELAPTRELFEKGGPVSAELHAFLTAELPEWYETLDPNVRARLDDGASIPASEYLGRLAQMRRMGASAAERLTAVDVLASPTVANTPPRLEDIATPETYRPQNLLALRNTCVASYLGLCAITLPVGLDAARMPVGLQLVARPLHEVRLLAVAAAVEDALGTGRDRLGTPPRAQPQ